MSFKEFIRKHDLKNETTSDTKIYQVLSSLFLNDIGVHSRDGPFSDLGKLMTLKLFLMPSMLNTIVKMFFLQDSCIN